MDKEALTISFFRPEDAEGENIKRLLEEQQELLAQARGTVADG